MADINLQLDPYSYSRSDLMEAYRQVHPELRQASDNDLFRSIAVDRPDLAKGISELKPQPRTSFGQALGDEIFHQAPAIAGAAIGGGIGGTVGGSTGAVIGGGIGGGGSEALVGGSPSEIAGATGGGMLPGLIEKAHPVVGPLVQRGLNAVGLGTPAGASQADIAATKNISKLRASTPEAQATAGRIADEALQRGSVPTSAHPDIVDSQVYRRFQIAKANLEAAKKAIPAGQRVAGQPLLDQIDNAIDGYSVKTPIKPKYNADRSIVQQQSPGVYYTPINGYTQPEVIETARLSNLGRVRNQIGKLVDAGGNISRESLQSLKEQLDREIYDHAGWSDTGQATDRANLAALREANHYVRDALNNLGNPDLNAANDSYSHYADLAKIVDSRRPDLAGLGLDQKVARAMTPLTVPQTPSEVASRFGRSATSIAAKGLGGYGLYRIARDLWPF